MKKIKDERLKIQHLKNIRIAFIVQTAGILLILANEFIKKGLAGMTKHPLWFVFIITMIVSTYLSMNISVEYENKRKNPKKSYIVSLIVIGIISVVSAVLSSVYGNVNSINGVFVGGIIFICAFIPFTYIYYLRIKRQKNHGDE